LTPATASNKTDSLSRWVREHSERRQRSVAADAGTARGVFVAMPVALPTANSPTVPAADESQPTARMNLQARLPNGVVFDLRELDVQQAGVVIEALGRVRCSVSTKA
jgi:transposase